MAKYVERVAERAEQIQIVRVLLSLVALPFFVAGAVVGLLWMMLRWLFAAAVVGFEQVVSSEALRKRGDDAAG